MNLNKLRIRIAGWFVLMALKISAMFRPVPKEEGAGGTPSTALRIETDVETTLSPGQLAVLLRNLAQGNAHAATLLSLAEGVEDARPAPSGTRGSIVLKGDDMRMDPEASGKALENLYKHTRHVTREPGNLVEIMISVVVTSNATTVDPLPVTGLTINYTKDDKS